MVVRQNLINSFPELTAKEIKEIEKKFFSHLCDLFLETIKAISIGKNELVKRSTYPPSSIKLFSDLYSQNKDIIIVMGHFGNWEWAGIAMNFFSDYKLNVIYKKISNPYFNDLMKNLRSRFGAVPVEMRETVRVFSVKAEKPSATVFITDQSPNPQHAIWIPFLNQETPVFNGVEKMALKYKQPVVFASVRKIKRGHYKVIAELLQIDEEKGITASFFKKLEEEIRLQPEMWLWSHKRWKHKKNKF
jgi:Kdo2-lipid IVA lauroyltransferase/acyltransferase